MGNENPKRHTVKRGLDLPITGEVTTKEVVTAPAPSRVALLAADYVGMRPSMKVKVGDQVKRGQILFEDRKNPGVLFASPGCGEVEAINRGARRALKSVVIKLSDADGIAAENEVTYEGWSDKPVANWSAAALKSLLVSSGFWTAFRVRPFSKVLPLDTDVRSFFVTAMDSNPLAPDAALVINARAEEFQTGLGALAQLADGKPIYLCKAAGTKLPDVAEARVVVHEFSGHHPAGTAGYHIHRVDPVNRERSVAYIGYQDVIALGVLVKTGKQDFSRVISVAGPACTSPALLSTRVGAKLDTLIDGRVEKDACVIIGSVFNGRKSGDKELDFLGRYQQQVSVIINDESRRFLGWLAPGFNRFSVTRLFGGALLGGKKFAFSNDRFGGHRTPVPFASYDKVNPFDIMPVFLLRSLLAKDLESAEQLGALEFDEEDMSLFTFVCPSKNEYGPALRNVLTQIEKEG